MTTFDRERIRAWASDLTLSAQIHVPHYANPGELKRDILWLLRALEQAEQRLELAIDEERGEQHAADVREILNEGTLRGQPL